MPRITLVFAVLLIMLGVIGYAGDPTDSKPTDSNSNVVSTPSGANGPATKPKRSITALIPALTGGLLLICGALALKERWRMHAMHGAVLIGLLGFLAAGGRAASGIAQLMSPDAAVNTRSLFFVCVMALLCGAYVAVCVNSFVQAQRRRREEQVQLA